MAVDWDAILTKSILTLVPAAATWLFSNLIRLKGDMNAAFRKIRVLERKLGLDDEST